MGLRFLRSCFSILTMPACISPSSMRLPFILTLIPSSLLPLVVGSPSPSITYALLHRFIPHSPSSSIPDYIPYGTIALHHDATNPTYQVIGELINLNDRDPMMDDGQGWYQLGLRVDDQILTTSTRSVRSCYSHLRTSFSTTHRSLFYTLSVSKISRITSQVEPLG